MNNRLTWQELSTLKPGACVAFGEVEHIHTTAGIVDLDAGTVCTIMEQGLADMWCGLVVRPVCPDLQRKLTFHQDDHDGCAILAGPCDGNPSPFVLDDSCPMECI